jgi:hypothetical protein
MFVGSAVTLTPLTAFATPLAEVVSVMLLQLMVMLLALSDKLNAVPEDDLR